MADIIKKSAFHSLAVLSVGLYSVLFPSGMLSKYFLLHSNRTLPFTIGEEYKKEDGPLHSVDVIRPECCRGKKILH